MLKKTDSGNRADWLLFADDDLRAVKLLSEHKTSCRVCRSKLAESLEKLLKGDLVGRGWNLDRTHDLQRLCDKLAEYDSVRAEQIQSTVDDLAEAYTEDRYPGFDFDDHDDWDELTALLSKVELYRLLLDQADQGPRTKNIPPSDHGQNDQ